VKSYAVGADYVDGSGVQEETGREHDRLIRCYFSGTIVHGLDLDVFLRTHKGSRP